MFGKLGQAISDLFNKKKLSESLSIELEEILISSDISPTTSHKICDEFSKNRFDKDTTLEQLKKSLASNLLENLEGSEQKFELIHKPFVFLMSGVNGSGKTTTIAKLAYKYKKMGKKILIAAADTFRAAAVEQLSFWAGKVGADFISATQNTDPSSLAFDALKKAQVEKYDILFIDTAGRLQNKESLMAELSKLTRTLKKLDATAPHASVMVLDATTGQNALSQLTHFKDAAQINSLILTKLDGSSKGGIVISLFSQYKIPLSFIGNGEGLENLVEFNAKNFIEALLDIQ